MLYELVYMSRATKMMGTHDLLELLKESRKANEKYHVTGMLLYKDMSFLQLIEGEKEDLEDLYLNLKKDPRHENLTDLIMRPISSRSFSDWTMGFQNLGDVEINTDELPGFSNFMHVDFDPTEIKEQSGAAVELLLYFRTQS